MERKRWNCKRPQSIVLPRFTIDARSSTITYDTLVRAGVKVQSAFVSADDSKSVNPPVAKGSRGIGILPDTYFEPGNSGPVGVSSLSLPHARTRRLLGQVRPAGSSRRCEGRGDDFAESGGAGAHSQVHRCGQVRRDDLCRWVILQETLAGTMVAKLIYVQVASPHRPRSCPSSR